jgi:allantoicase
MSEPTSGPWWVSDSVNVAAPRLGTEVIRCSDDFFGPAPRMLSDAPPAFDPAAFDSNGKWMDGWESRRRRDGGHDWCVLKLGLRAALHGVDVDTAHFTGNYPPHVSVLAADTFHEPQAGEWTEVVGRGEVGPDAHNYFDVRDDRAWRWLRLDIFPDGGVARFRAYGEVRPDHDPPPQPVELSAIANGGRVLAYSDAHYGDVWAVLTAGRGRTMGDGWETRRRRGPGSDWLLLRLGRPGRVEAIEVDTAHFKGNFPAACSVQAALLPEGQATVDPPMAAGWPELLGRRPLSADAVHVFRADDLHELGPVSHVRLNIHPDGGISRIRLWGRPAGPQA